MPGKMPRLTMTAKMPTMQKVNMIKPTLTTTHRSSLMYLLFGELGKNTIQVNDWKPLSFRDITRIDFGGKQNEPTISG
jgi:hypothetical protein